MTRQVYVQNFKDNADIIEAYNAPKDALDGATVYLAWYGYGACDGSSLVIFEKDGVLYEVNGSHCSCYGLENQWEPEVTSWDALGMRDFTGGTYVTEGEKEASDILKALVAERPTTNPIKPLNDRS